MSGPAPFGTKWLDGRLVPDLGEIGTVRDLVEAFVAAAGRAKTASAALNANSLRTRRGKPWTDIAVVRVIRNPALRDLLTVDQWTRLSELLHARNSFGPARRAAHPLGGVVHCSCGGRMYLRGDDAPGKFVCKVCRAKVQQNTLEKLFVQSLFTVKLEPDEILQALADNPRAAELNRSFGGQAVALSEIWSLLDPNEARQLVDLLVDRITVGADEVSIVLAKKADQEPSMGLSPNNSSPSSHGSDAARKESTRRRYKNSRSEESPRRIVEPKAYRISHVAQLLSLPKATTYDLVRTGALASIRTGTNGGVVLVPASAVDAFLEKKRGRR